MARNASSRRRTPRSPGTAAERSGSDRWCSGLRLGVVHEMWLLEAQAHHAEGGCFVLTNHPFISGRPSKAAALERLIEDVRALDGMWVAPLREIAEHARSTVPEVRRIARVECPEGCFDGAPARFPAAH